MRTSGGPPGGSGPRAICPQPFGHNQLLLKLSPLTQPFTSPSLKAAHTLLHPPRTPCRPWMRNPVKRGPQEVGRRSVLRCPHLQVSSLPKILASPKQNFPQAHPQRFLSQSALSCPRTGCVYSASCTENDLARKKDCFRPNGSLGFTSPWEPNSGHGILALTSPNPWGLPSVQGYSSHDPQPEWPRGQDRSCGGLQGQDPRRVGLLLASRGRFRDKLNGLSPMESSQDTTSLGLTLRPDKGGQRNCSGVPTEYGKESQGGAMETLFLCAIAPFWRPS